MTQEEWNKLSREEKDRQRSDAGLTPQLIGLEGYRVEVITTYNEKRRFIVGRSTGWVPCHVELKRIDSIWGDGADKEYKSVKVIRKVR